MFCYFYCSIWHAAFWYLLVCVKLVSVFLILLVFCLFGCVKLQCIALSCHHLERIKFFLFVILVFIFLLKGFMAPIVENLYSSSVTRTAEIISTTHLYHSRRHGLMPGSTAGIITMIWQLSKTHQTWIQLSNSRTFQSGLDYTEMVKTDMACYCELFLCIQYRISSIVELFYNMTPNLLSQPQVGKHPSCQGPDFVTVLWDKITHLETKSWKCAHSIIPPQQKTQLVKKTEHALHLCTYPTGWTKELREP